MLDATSDFTSFSPSVNLNSPNYACRDDYCTTYRTSCVNIS